MTYILGARCADGVVMIADKKITKDSGVDFEYSDKLFCDHEQMIIGFSGSRGTFELFRTRFTEYWNYQTNVVGEEPKIPSILLKISDISFELSNRYRMGYDSFDILVGISGTAMPPNKGSTLYYFYEDGRMEPATGYRAIGSGSVYGSFLLKQMWRDDMTMNEVAKLGDFIIRYIEKFRLDMTVGIDIFDPQIWCIPNQSKRYQLDCEIVRKFSTENKKRLSKFERNIHNLWK